eukprot:CAMPEP_0176021046 /NCGR_PEP_ID=MMETSP0120_2-20121206/10211_1 /TAXON_ID=160619 /ORGANISM="Kryptoperidinium foliaceum, Strain CCMP 1326" /LENGTH=76 /DNA_ID=CAMNT_0017354155 /DNA_START=47 /DNA_END=277 /DNA_ORIENTATION=-
MDGVDQMTAFKKTVGSDAKMASVARSPLVQRLTALASAATNSKADDQRVRAQVLHEATFAFGVLLDWASLDEEDMM